MAGRPRKRAEQAQELELAVIALLGVLLRVAPRAVLDGGALRPNASTWARAWGRLVGCIVDTADTARTLGDLCRARAGIDAPGPLGELLDGDRPTAAESAGNSPETTTEQRPAADHNPAGARPRPGGRRGRTAPTPDDGQA